MCTSTVLGALLKRSLHTLNTYCVLGSELPTLENIKESFMLSTYWVNSPHIISTYYVPDTSLTIPAYNTHSVQDIELIGYIYQILIVPGTGLVAPIHYIYCMPGTGLIGTHTLNTYYMLGTDWANSDHTLSPYYVPDITPGALLKNKNNPHAKHLLCGHWTNSSHVLNSHYVPDTGVIVSITQCLLCVNMV